MAITQTGVTGGNVVAAKRADYGYNLAGQVTDLRRYSAATPSSGSLEVHSRSGYDSAGRLTSLIHNRTEITGSSPYTGGSSLPTSVTPAGAIAAYAFTFDAGNQMTAMSSYADRFRTTYGYDNSDQLTTASSVAIAGLAAPTFLPVAEGYQLDANGNRRSSTGASQSAAGTHNQLQTDGTFNYTYDNEGNTTRKTAIAGGAYTEYVWNHRNQLTAVIDRTSAGAQVKQSDYSYDAFDRRVLDRYDTPGAAGYDRYDWFITDGQHELIVMRDSNGAATVQNYRIANRFLHGASVDEVLSDEQYASGSGPLLSSTTASTIAGTTLWTIADHLGSIRDVVDNNGVVRQHVVYDSFGRRVNEVDRNAAGAVIASNSTEAIDELFGYTGRDFDAETGLQYNRARWFDPGTGRCMSHDPIGFEPGDANLYRYVGNRPTKHTDPTGLQPPSTGIAATIPADQQVHEAVVDKLGQEAIDRARGDLLLGPMMFLMIIDHQDWPNDHHFLVWSSSAARCYRVSTIGVLEFHFIRTGVNRLQNCKEGIPLANIYQTFDDECDFWSDRVRRFADEGLKLTDGSHLPRV